MLIVAPLDSVTVTGDGAAALRQHRDVDNDAAAFGDAGRGAQA